MRNPSQLFFIGLVSVVMSIGIASFITVPNVIIIVGFILAVGMIISFWRKDWYKVGVACIIFVCLAASMRTNTVITNKDILVQFGQALQDAKSNNARNHFALDIYGYTQNRPYIQNGTQRIVFHVVHVRSVGTTITTDSNVLVTAGQFPSYSYGDILHMNGVLVLPSSALVTSTGTFDHASYLHKEGIFTIMQNPKIETASLKLNFSTLLKIYIKKSIFAIESKFEHAISRSLPEPHAALMMGLLLGERSQVPAEVQLAFQRTGTSHILAVSGYNITIIAGTIISLLLLIVSRRYAFWIANVVIILFVIMTGAQASVVRAALMGGLMLYAQREGRLYSAYNALWCAAVVMLFMNPLLLRYDIGFQLSFGATLGLIVGASWIQSRLTWLPELLQEPIAVTLAAQIFVIPLLIYYFKQLSLVFLPVNMLVLPVVPFAMAVGAVTGLLGMLYQPLGMLIGYGSWVLTSYILYVVRAFSQLSWASIQGVSSWLVIFVYGAIVVGIVIREYSKYYYGAKKNI